MKNDPNKLEIPIFIKHCKEGTNTIRALKLAKAEYEAKLKTQKEIDKIEHELDMELPFNDYFENKKKRSRSNQLYFRSIEMKTECTVNAEEDLFDIDEEFMNLPERLLSFKKGERIICAYKRKKIRGTILESDNQKLIIKTSDRKKIEWTLQQLEEDKIRIEKGNFVIWDEAHFGVFSQAYLDRKFYFDVHPPLGKMLTAASGYIYGQSNDFSFKSSDKFPDKFDYVGMRRFHAAIASFVPLFAYLILRESNFSVRRSSILSLLFIFDNGMTSISRIILLDSHLLAFTAATTYFFVRFQFKDSYWSLFWLGLSIGCVLSVKWIGCLTTLYVGIYIIYLLYNSMIMDNLIKFIKLFMQCAFFLIISPIFIYILFFTIHFKLVNESSPDAGSFSLNFNLSLKNNSYNDYWKYISFGRQITLKIEGGYLHSHKHPYPNETTTHSNESLKTSAMENTNEIKDNSLANTLPNNVSTISDKYQVTFYAHKDENNSFYLQKVEDSEVTGFLRNGDEIVILHSETKGYLATDKKPSYIEKGIRVYCKEESPNESSVWIVEAIKETFIQNGKIDLENINLQKNTDLITSLFTKFYLKNKSTGLYLSKSGKKYPNWGFQQGEIFLTSKKDGDNSIFTIDENLFAESEQNAKHGHLKSHFLKKLIELNAHMYKVNKSFVTDPDLERNRIDSDPWEWFILLRGLRMSQWGNDYKFYMFFNPLLLYASSISIIYMIFRFLSELISSRIIVEIEKMTADIESPNRKISNFIKMLEIEKARCRKRSISTDGYVSSALSTKKKHSKTVFKSYLCVFGWMLHYFPFFIVGRVLYFHHYFPAYFYAILSICINMKKIKYSYLTLFVLSVLAVYILYSPLTYGFLEQEKLKYLKVVPSWDFID